MILIDSLLEIGAQNFAYASFRGIHLTLTQGLLDFLHGVAHTLSYLLDPCRLRQLLSGERRDSLQNSLVCSLFDDVTSVNDDKKKKLSKQCISFFTYAT